MAQLKKEMFAKHLDKIPVLIQDTSPNSEYFLLNNLPTVLYAGKNGFLIGGSNLLKASSAINIEITDALGNPIYFEIPDILVAGTFRLVSIYVYSDTPIGLATITIMAEAQQFSGNNAPIPAQWVGKPNVKWTKKVKVDTLMGSDTPAILQKPPTISITEIYDASQSLDVVLTPVTFSYNDSNGAMGTAFNSKQTNAAYYVQLTTGSFIKEMEGGIINFPNPSSALSSSGYNRAFTTQITRVVNESTAQVSPSYVVSRVDSENYPGSQDFIRANFGQPIEFTSPSAFVLSYVSQSQNTGSANKRISYLNVKVKSLDTYVGSLKYIDIFRQPGNIFVGRYPIQPQEMLCKNNSWVVYGQNQWSVEMTNDWKSGSDYYPTNNDWTASVSRSNILYSGLYNDTGVSTPYTNSLTLYYFSPAIDFFGIGYAAYDGKLAKFSSYINVSASFVLTSSATVDDGVGIYVDDTLVASQSSPANIFQYSINFVSGTRKVDLYLKNTSGSTGPFLANNMSLILSQSLSTNPNIIGMNAYIPPPMSITDNTKLLNGINLRG